MLVAVSSDQANGVARARGYLLAPLWAMAAARRVLEEVLGCCRQTDLLACRRSCPSVAPTRSTRKSDLIAELVALGDGLASRQRICSDLMATWTMHELRLLLARLRGLGCMVASGPRRRQADLIAVIISTTEYAHSLHSVGKRGRPRVGESHASGPSEKVSKGLCPSSEISVDPGPAAEPSSSMALVALDSSAAPVPLRQQLLRRWSKKWARYAKKKERKRNVKRIEEELRKALRDHGETAIVGDLRAMVGQTLGLPLDGKYRWRFDRALSKLTSPPPRKCRARRRFTIAEGGLRTKTRSRKASRVESA